MNKHGREYIIDVSKKFSSLSSDIKNGFVIEDWMVSETIMRLGIESRIYELNTYEELRQIALATVRESFINNPDIWIERKTTPESYLSIG